MRAIGLIVLVVVICSGCATRMPLKSLSDANHTPLNVQSKTDGKAIVFTETVAARKTRQGSAQGGLVGVIVGGTVAYFTDKDSGAVLREIRQKAGCVEDDVFAQAVKQELKKSGFTLSDQKAGRALMLQLDGFGLEEMQCGFWQVRAYMTATLCDANQKKPIGTAQALPFAVSTPIPINHNSMPTIFAKRTKMQPGSLWPAQLDDNANENVRCFNFGCFDFHRVPHRSHFLDAESRDQNSAC